MLALALVLGGGAILAPAAWYGGGWWYGIRARWSGCDPERKSARAVSGYQGLVEGTLNLAVFFWATASAPASALGLQPWRVWDVTAPLFGFWATWVSYSGVKTRFDISGGRARLLFLFLPLLIYVLAFAAGVLGVELPVD